jgi:hypothetical protein
MAVMREQVVKVRLELEPPEPDLFIRWLRDAIKIRAVVLAEPKEEPQWVLVQGYHDSGTIDGVYGPYTEAEADWLLAGPLSSSYGNLTKVKLSRGPEEA